MSRIGKHPVKLATGVTATVNGKAVTVKGKLGELSLDVRDDVTVEQQDGALVVTPATKENRFTVAQWATTRALLASMVKGVTEGYKKEMELRGVGYKAAVQGKVLVLNLGYSHDIKFPIPEKITITTPTPTEIIVTGADKQRVGQVAADIRSYRAPEPYKGKGVRYKGEHVALKEGKKK
jgi:large subunit ribosomal protein L6